MDSWIADFLLVGLVLTPALGALAAGFCPSRAIRVIRVIGWSFSMASLVMWIALKSWLSGMPGDDLLVSIQLPWVSVLGIGLHLGLDQTGVMMAGLVSLIGVVATVGTLPSLPELNRSHIVCLLLAEAGMLGVVASWDLILFIVFWEMTLVPFFFLMGRGPTKAGVTAASRFFVTSVASSVLMWVGVLMVVKLAGSPRTFDLAELADRLAGDIWRSSACVWMFAPAFLVRMAAVPLHTWYPVAAANVPTAASILLAGGVLPLGGYGFVHVLCRLFGPKLCGLGSWFVWIGLITCLGGALASLVQRDLKRLLAHICLARVGLALVGLMLSLESGHYGGLIMLVAAGLEGGGLFLFAGVVCNARGSQRILDMGGLWRSHPFFAGLAFAGVASAAALPGTVGFVGSALILRGILANWLVASLAAGGVLLTGISVLWVFRRILGGSFQQEVWTRLDWPRKRQASMLALIVLVVVATGIGPGLLLSAQDSLANKLNQPTSLSMGQPSLPGAKP